jgi:hypothetical protein
VRKAFYKAVFHWVGDVNHDDWNAGRRGLGCTHRVILEGDDQIDGVSHKLGSGLVRSGLIGQIAPV